MPEILEEEHQTKIIKILKGYEEKIVTINDALSILVDLEIFDEQLRLTSRYGGPIRGIFPIIQPDDINIEEWGTSLDNYLNRKVERNIDLYGNYGSTLKTISDLGKYVSHQIDSIMHTSNEGDIAIVTFTNSKHGNELRHINKIDASSISLEPKFIRTESGDVVIISLDAVVNNGETS